MTHNFRVVRWTVGLHYTKCKWALLMIYIVQAAQAAQLTQQLTGMDPAILLNILKNVPNVDRTSQQGQNLGQTSQPSSSLPTVASMLQSAGIRPLPQGQVQSQGSLNPGFTNLGPQNHPGGQSQMINSQFQQGLSHNGEQVPKLAGEANQGQSADISGQLMALMNSFKWACILPYLTSVVNLWVSKHQMSLNRIWFAKFGALS